MNRIKHISRFKYYMYKYFCGPQEFKIEEDTFSYPKELNYIIPAIILMLTFQKGSVDISFMFYSGVILFFTGLFSHFYSFVFPLTREDLDSIIKYYR